MRFLPPLASKQRVGLNFTKDTFSTWEVSLATYDPWVFHTCTTPFSLPDKMNLESGVKEHSMIEDSFKKFVYLYNSAPLNASKRMILLSDVARTKYSPLGLNFMIFISL